MGGDRPADLCAVSSLKFLHLFSSQPHYVLKSHLFDDSRIFRSGLFVVLPAMWLPLATRCHSLDRRGCLVAPTRGVREIVLSSA